MGGMTRRQVLTGMTVGTAAVALPTFVFTSIAVSYTHLTLPTIYSV